MTDNAALAQEVEPNRPDDFDGDNDHLITCIDALLDLDDGKALVPHGLGKGSHAYRLLTAARHRIPRNQPQQPSEDMVERIGMALCAAALGGKRCPCAEKGKFSCVDEHPGLMARVAIAAMQGAK